jgi:hypothetical protein
MAELNQEVYKTIFETWRYEVNSYWQRNSYFAAFEVAALAGCWHVVEQAHRWSGLAFSFAGLVSTVAWLVTSVAVHRYISYWWESIKHIEGKLLLVDSGFDFAKKHPGSGLHPSRWVHVIPVLFMGAWVVILVFAIRCLCSCKGC